MAGRTKLQPHLTAEEVKERYRTATDRAERTHFHVLWLISQGESQARTARLVGISDRWVQEIVKRYNEGGVEAMRDRRHDHPGPGRVLDAAGEQVLLAALQERPSDGGLWTSQKVAAWIGRHTGQRVSTVSGWRTLRRLGQKPQRPRPRHKRADPEAQEAFKEAAGEAPERSTGEVPGRGGRDVGDG
jgi:transposase